MERPQKKQVLLFYCEEAEDLARKVAAHSDLVRLQSINWSSVGAEEILFVFADMGCVPSSRSFCHICTSYAVRCLIYSGVTFLFQLVPLNESKRKERFYFNDTILPVFETGIPLLKQRLQQLPKSDKIVVAFPDDGAWKRFHKLLDHFPMVICNKVREGDKRIVRIKEGDPAGCHVVIVDDLVQSGGTLIECQKVLAAHGAAKVSAYVTHGVFPKRSWERFVHKNEESEKAFAHFWITDSCPSTVKAIASKAPFEVLSLAGSIADALQI
ncbi:Ribose-phosphate pyrophosphokinase [Sesamum angolense]|uniref:Ribose-phosphate pyrophosphokinase n=1 Tax=Sesamum angolense TaxID=2727404 RepID=A0AAE1WRE5_9LAMI|nr:Ribose-phosphate pyrophosphokinase [Sesamum angolense]